MAKDKNVTLQKAMHSLNTVEVYYAKMVCRMSNAARLKIYRKIASLMANRFSLMNALDRLHDSVSNGGKNPGEPMAIAIAQLGKSPAKRSAVFRCAQRLGTGPGKADAFGRRRFRP